MKTFVAFALLVLLAGCGGRDFLRPRPEAFTLGSTTYEQVVQTSGPPSKTSAGTLHGAPITTAFYLHGAVGPLGTSFSVRQMVCVFSDGLLVSYDYASSFDADKTPFDEAKVRAVKKGDAKAEVSAALGEPTGKAIYPVVATKGGSLFRYTFLQTEKIPFVPKSKETRKVATVSFDSDDKVLDVRIVETKSD